MAGEQHGGGVRRGARDVQRECMSSRITVPYSVVGRRSAMRCSAATAATNSALRATGAKRASATTTDPATTTSASGRGTDDGTATADATGRLSPWERRNTAASRSVMRPTATSVISGRQNRRATIRIQIAARHPTSRSSPEYAEIVGFIDSPVRGRLAAPRSDCRDRADMVAVTWQHDGTVRTTETRGLRVGECWGIHDNPSARDNRRACRHCRTRRSTRSSSIGQEGIHRVIRRRTRHRHHRTNPASG